MIKIGDTIPEVVIPVRIPATEETEADWKHLNTKEQFAGKRVLLLVDGNVAQSSPQWKARLC